MESFIPPLFAEFYQNEELSEEENKNSSNQESEELLPNYPENSIYSFNEILEAFED